LQTEKNRISPVEGAEAAFRKPAQRFSRRFLRGRYAQLQLLFAAFLEDAQNVSGVAQIETRQGIEEGENAVKPGVGRRYGSVVDQAQRRAIGAIALAEAVILQIKAAVIVERRAPEHRAVIHHAVIDVADDRVVAKAAGLFGD